MEFIETPLFEKAAKRLLSEEEIIKIQRVLIKHPDSGVLISGGKGLRKLRWAAEGRGKRGGLRIIYYWVTQDNQIYLLDMYQKNQKEDLTAEQIKYLKLLMEN